MTWLAYVHPAAMVLILATGIWVLRLGLAIRRGRQVGRPTDSRRHRRIARWFVPLAVIGWTAGLFSMAFIRGKPVLASVHFPFATAAATGIAVAGLIGLWLERHPRSNARTAHALFGAIGLLIGLAAAAAGMAILP